ncbi:Transcriptional activator Myb [Smittium culicis]|uniref:Transcriptional activator Myb n=1 Tax=Smittium culicis TaxID=133412 RepID=A0A1R1YBA9_9FUNG|nr:Transcriptional activator Myb [Smittium culicis]
MSDTEMSLKDALDNLISPSNPNTCLDLGIAPVPTIGKGLVQADLMAQKASKGDKVKNYRTAKYRVCKSNQKSLNSNGIEKSKVELAIQAKENAKLLIQSLGSEGGILTDASQFLFDVDNSLDTSDQNMTFPKMRSMWTISEDRLLTLGVRLYGANTESWPKIAVLVPGRTNKACRKRWFHSLDPSLHKGSWSAEEDSLLINWVTKLPGQWSKIAKKIQGRTDDQCAKRWRESLDPSISRSKWTKVEDDILIEKYNELGAQWQKIATFFQGRPGLHCRNRWRKIQRRSQQEKSTNSNNQELDPSLDCSPPSIKKSSKSANKPNNSTKKRSRESVIDNPSLLMSPLIKKPFIDPSSSINTQLKKNKKIAKSATCISKKKSNISDIKFNDDCDLNKSNNSLDLPDLAEYPHFPIPHDVDMDNSLFLNSADLLNNNQTFPDFQNQFFSQNSFSKSINISNPFEDFFSNINSTDLPPLDLGFYNQNNFPITNISSLCDVQKSNTTNIQDSTDPSAPTKNSAPKQKKAKKTSRSPLNIPSQDKRDYLLKANIKLYGCAALIGICNEVFSDPNELEFHLQNVHNYTNSNNDSNPAFDANNIKWSHVYRCGMPGCSSLYKNIRGLEYHIFHSRKSDIHFTEFESFKSKQKSSIYNLTNDFDCQSFNTNFINGLNSTKVFKDSNKIEFDNSIEFLLSNNEANNKLDMLNKQPNVLPPTSVNPNFNLDVLSTFVNSSSTENSNPFDGFIFARKAISNCDFPTEKLFEDTKISFDSIFEPSASSSNQFTSAESFPKFEKLESYKLDRKTTNIAEAGAKYNNSKKLSIGSKSGLRKNGARSMSMSGLDDAYIVESFKDGKLDFQNQLSQSNSNRILNFDTPKNSDNQDGTPNLQTNLIKQLATSANSCHNDQFYQIYQQAMLSQNKVSIPNSNDISNLIILNNTESSKPFLDHFSTETKLESIEKTPICASCSSAVATANVKTNTSENSSEPTSHLSNHTHFDNHNHQINKVNNFEQKIHEFLEYFENKIENNINLKPSLNDEYRSEPLANISV